MKFKRYSNEIVHPTQKPIELFEWFIKTYTNTNELVLDFCLGSGTTAVAALRTGRRFIGIELSEEYCNIARKRVAEELAHPRLIDHVPDVRKVIEPEDMLFQ